MIGMYLFQRYLNKLDDFKFQDFWVNKVLRRQRMYWGLLLIYFIVAMSIITEVLLIGNESFFFGFLVVSLTFILYGGYFLRTLLRFIGNNNGRYLQTQMGVYQEQSTFSKDNVVG